MKKLELFGKASVEITKSACRKSRRLAKTYVSVFLVMLLFTTVTFSWFTFQDGVSIKSQTLSLEAANTMRTNDRENSSTLFTISDIKLEEASSVDGRNVYFPATGTFSDAIKDMKFREANVGDNNVRYIYETHQLTGDSRITNVYVKSYRIAIGSSNDTSETILSDEVTFDSSGVPNRQIYEDQISVLDRNSDGKLDWQSFPTSCPIRIAFIIDSQEQPITIDPAARIRSFASNYKAIDYIDKESGMPVLKEQNSDSFSSYYYGTGNPVVSIPGNQSVNVTMVAWLEGTAENADDYVDRPISIDVELESNITGMKPIYLVDDTVGDDTCNTAYLFEYGGTNHVKYEYNGCYGYNDATRTIAVGIISNFSNYNDGKYKVHYWGGDGVTAGDVTLSLSDPSTKQKSVGSSYWSGNEQTFYMFTAEIPINAEHFQVWHDDTNDTWFASGANAAVPMNWLSGCITAVSYRDPIASTATKDVYKTVIMNLVSGYSRKWYAMIPEAVETNISFYRLSDPSKQSDQDVNAGTIYNSWITKTGVNDLLYNGIRGTESSEYPDWRESHMNSGNLQESRRIDGVLNDTYTARRGNGYGVVTHANNDSATYQKWLSPCIGYWGYEGAPVTPDDPDTPTPPVDPDPDDPTPPPANTVTITVELRIAANDSGLEYVRTDLSSSGNYDMYAHFSDSTSYKMSYDAGATTCKLDSLQIPSGTSITGFEMINRTDGTSKGLITLNKSYTFVSNWTITYELKDYGKKAYTN